MIDGFRARAFRSAAQAALDSLRNIARGIYPPVLADFRLAEALRAQAAHAAIAVRLIGTASRSTADAEEAVYFCCLEAIQNAAKHAGRTARVELRLHQHPGTLRVRIADDGRGFDPAQVPAGAGLQNIRDRIQERGGRFETASRPGHGTVLIISLPGQGEPRCSCRADRSWPRGAAVDGYSAAQEE